MTGTIVRVTGHPEDPEVLLLHVPHGGNDLMGKYEPAQLDTELKAYLLHIDQLQSFERFAAYAGWRLLDERAKTRRQVALSNLCDRCTKSKADCQRAAGNRGRWRDHDFIPMDLADAQRAEEAQKRALRS
jgi:hypothetical protein